MYEQFLNVRNTEVSYTKLPLKMFNNIHIYIYIYTIHFLLLAFPHSLCSVLPRYPVATNAALKGIGRTCCVHSVGSPMMAPHRPQMVQLAYTRSDPHDVGRSTMAVRRGAATNPDSEGWRARVSFGGWTSPEPSLPTGDFRWRVMGRRTILRG